MATGRQQTQAKKNVHILWEVLIRFLRLIFDYNYLFVNV